MLQFIIFVLTKPKKNNIIIGNKLVLTNLLRLLAFSKEVSPERYFFGTQLAITNSTFMEEYL